MRIPQKQFRSCLKCLTPIDGREAAAFGGRPKPFFSPRGSLLSPHTTGISITPLRRRSVRNLSAFRMAESTVSLLPAKITYSWKQL